MAHFEMFFYSAYKLHGYKPTQNPLRSCISPGLITGILRFYGKSMLPPKKMLNLLSQIHGKTGKLALMTTVYHGSDYNIEQYLISPQNYPTGWNSL